MDAATGSAWPLRAIQDLDDAILHTLVYADLFDYPLKVKEIHRYLTGYAAPLAMVERHLEEDGRLSGRLASISPWWFLAGREHLAELRRERTAYSQVLWPQARRYGHLIAALPFVRLVSITGSLAMNNVRGPRDDIDLLIVAAKDRLWLARGLAILVVHLARRAGVEICPNYFIAEHRLQVDEPSLFTAHELAQLIPLDGADVYRRLLRSNHWMSHYLPNASPQQPAAGGLGTPVRSGQRLMEGVLGGRLGDAVELWERQRKIPRLYQTAAQKGGKGISFSPELCKGHMDNHADVVLESYANRLAANGILSPQG